MTKITKRNMESINYCPKESLSEVRFPDYFMRVIHIEREDHVEGNIFMSTKVRVQDNQGTYYTTTVIEKGAFVTVEDRLKEINNCFQRFIRDCYNAESLCRADSNLKDHSGDFVFEKDENQDD